MLTIKDARGITYLTNTCSREFFVASIQQLLPSILCWLGLLVSGGLNGYAFSRIDRAIRLKDTGSQAGSFEWRSPFAQLAIVRRFRFEFPDSWLSLRYYATVILAAMFIIRGVLLLPELPR
jgi:hypothetical protein